MPDELIDLADQFRPSLLRLTRQLRNQRVDISVTLGQISAMVTLRKSGPMSAGELASIERVTPPSLSKVLAHLEERGFVRRRSHETDRRQAIIELTEAGIALLESEKASRTEWLVARLATLTKHEQDLLRRIIPVLDKLAEQ